jgi:2,4-dienoyl-CoA reductase (NADPH2)
LALAIEAAGANIINTGYGWHEATVPTIAYQVPRGAWSFGAARLKKVVSIPVIASNRINTPDVAESILALGHADMISMARPLLADPDFVSKVAQGREDEINTCIACNQSCLDNIFTDKVATCLVNPRACREVEFELPARSPHRVAIAGSGPAGLAAAMECARRGHCVTLFEADAQLGGQLNLARRIPGKGEFNELLRYLVGQLRRMAVDIRLRTRVGAAELGTDRFDYVVVATGVVPRRPRVLGIDHPKVVGYIDVIRGHVELGKRVAIIGAGGIGHDVAEFLCGGRDPQSIDEFFREWGVDTTVSTGGWRPVDEPVANRKIYILQRGLGRVGERLGKSTGWILRTRLKHHKVQSIAGVSYRKIDDSGLHITVSGEDRVLEVDSVVICAGQDSDGRLSMELNNARIPHEAIGGALRSAGLDAARAIEEATRLAQRF